MCTCMGTCRCHGVGAGTGVGSFLGELAVIVLRSLLRLAWRATEILTVALIAALVWVTPRAWRLSVRVTRAGWRRWQTRRVTTAPDEAPVPAAALAITADRRITWSELQLKELTNR